MDKTTREYQGRHNPNVFQRQDSQLNVSELLDDGCTAVASVPLDFYIFLLPIPFYQYHFVELINCCQKIHTAGW